MILFLSQFKDSEFEKYSSQFSKISGIKNLYKTVSDIIDKSVVTLSCDNNNFFSVFNGINFDEIKICYINAGINVYKEYFDFESDLDNEYARMEWSALITCLAGVSSKTKFINKYRLRYSCSNQLENSIIFQKFDIDTPEAFLTNNAEDFLNFYHIYNENLIIKNVISKYDIQKKFSIEDLQRIKKLYLSPYIFQNPIEGTFVSVLVIGNTLLAVNEMTKAPICIPSGLKEKLINATRTLDVSIVKYRAIYKDDLFFFYDIDQSCLFSQLQFLFGNKFIDELTKFLVKEYEK